MPRTCTREQVRQVDRRALEEYGMPGVILMENAGRGAAEIACEMLEDPEDCRVAIFCGKGNNGGDGYVTARHLHNMGAQVKLVLACKPEEVDPESDAGANLRIAQAMDLPMIIADNADDLSEAEAAAKEADLIVDALFGTGLSGDLREPYLSLVRLINAADLPVLAIDIPSGLDADEGSVHRAAVRAVRTATFVLPKQGFTVNEGPGHVGEWTVVDIGVPRRLVDEVVPR